MRKNSNVFLQWWFLFEDRHIFGLWKWKVSINLRTLYFKAKVTSISCERGRNYKWEKFTSSLTNSRSVEDWCKREQGTHIKHGRAERPQQPREKVDRSVDPIRRNRRFASPRMRKYFAFYMHWCSYVTILEILSRKEEYRFKQNEYLR